jgi:hypothetical protein
MRTIILILIVSVCSFAQGYKLQGLWFEWADSIDTFDYLVVIEGDTVDYPKFKFDMIADTLIEMPAMIIVEDGDTLYPDTLGWHKFTWRAVWRDSINGVPVDFNIPYTWNVYAGQGSPTTWRWIWHDTVKVIAGDVNGDGIVSIIDAIMFPDYYGQPCGPGWPCEGADFNRDGEVNNLDVFIFQDAFTNAGTDSVLMQRMLDAIGEKN